MRSRFAGLTDTGLLREHNEDSLLLLPEYRVCAVADGMGGHRSGDVASQLAVSTLSDFFSITVGRDATWPFPVDPNLSEEENYIVTGLRLANRRIFDRSLRTVADFGMGTTIVSAMFNKATEKVTVGHVGDSRCYRIRGGEIVQLTRDHSLISDAAHMAPWMTEEEIRQLPPNVITRALGIREEVLVDILTDETREGDVYLLCSDGLSGMVSDPELLDVVMSTKSLDECCRTLIQQANLAGGADNITVVLARVEPDALDEESTIDTGRTPRDD
jgi:serine/threonine protein phosphatase PrpC